MATYTSGIYRIYCIADGREYIGRSVHIERRWAEHRKKLLLGNHRNPIMQGAWNKHGEASFKFEIVEILGRNELQQREQELLDELFAHGKPFNLRRDACGGADHTPEAIEKMSARRSQANAEMWKERRESGWKMSDEQRALLSAAASGREQSEEAKRKRSESMRQSLNARGGQWNKGKSQSDEEKAKRSAALKEYWRRKREASTV